MSDVKNFKKAEGSAVEEKNESKPKEAAEDRNDQLKARYSKPQDNRHKTPVKSMSKPMKH